MQLAGRRLPQDPPPIQDARSFDPDERSAGLLATGGPEVCLSLGAFSYGKIVSIYHFQFDISVGEHPKQSGRKDRRDTCSSTMFVMEYNVLGISQHRHVHRSCLGEIAILGRSQTCA